VKRGATRDGCGKLGHKDIDDKKLVHKDMEYMGRKRITTGCMNGT